MMKLNIQLFAENVVTIKTEIDIKNLEKGLNVSRKKLQEYEKEAETLEAERLKIQAQLEEEYLKKREEIHKKAQKEINEAYEYAEKMSTMEGWQGDETFADNVEGFKEYSKILGQVSENELKGIRDQEARQLKELDQSYQGILDKAEELEQQAIENAQAQEQLNEEISRGEKLLEGQKRQANIKDVLKSVGKELENNVKKVSRWALAIFGIRTIYNAISRAMTVISGNDAQLKADIDYMRNILAYTLEPIVRAIVNLAKELLNYVAYIAKLFGLNIFENANKSLKGANKQAKALSKTLAGFDEMTVLQDNSGSGSGTTAPSFDLGMAQEPPEWIERLAGIITGIATALGLLKLSQVAEKLGIIKGHLTGIQALGLGVMITGIIWLIQDLIKFLSDPTFEGFNKILIDIGVTIVGLGILIGNFPLIVTGVIIAIVAFFIQNYDKIMAKIKEFDKFMVYLWNKIKELFGPVGQILFSPFLLAYIKIRNTFEDLFGALKKIVGGIVKMFQGDFKGGVKEVFDGLVDIVKKPLNRIIDNINKMITNLNKVKIEIPDWLGGGTFGFNIKTIPRLARGGIVNNPGRGVMMGNYIAGESGAEAVLPLTDDTLQRLANMIPITVNVTNTMNGRVISRELQKVQNENDFAYNR